jgi:CBS domain containing-hemolysin-like protein
VVVASSTLAFLTIKMEVLNSTVNLLGLSVSPDTIVLALVGILVGFITIVPTIIALRNSRKLDAIHVLVNSRLSASLDQIVQLTRRLAEENPDSKADAAASEVAQQSVANQPKI